MKKRRLIKLSTAIIIVSLIAYALLPELREARFNIAFFCFVFPLVLLVVGLLAVKEPLDPAIWKPFAIVAVVYEILKLLLLIVALKLPLGLLVTLEAILVVILLSTLFWTLRKHKRA